MTRSQQIVLDAFPKVKGRKPTGYKWDRLSALEQMAWKHLEDVRHPKVEFVHVQQFPGSNWINCEAKIAGEFFPIEVLVFDVGSEYGVNGGKVSKIFVRDDYGREVIAYDRGHWLQKPRVQKGVRKIYNAILEKWN